MRKVNFPFRFGRLETERLLLRFCVLRLRVSLGMFPSEFGLRNVTRDPIDCQEEQRRGLATVTFLCRSRIKTPFRAQMWRARLPF